MTSDQRFVEEAWMRRWANEWPQLQHRLASMSHPSVLGLVRGIEREHGSVAASALDEVLARVILKGAVEKV